MYSKHIIKVIIWAMLIFAIATCGSEGSSSGESSDESSATDAIVLTDQFFSTDSFIAAGWKKSKEYDTATVPESTEIWYGFFQQKDIEIRFYASHEEAIEHGVPSAEESIEGAVKRSKLETKPCSFIHVAHVPRASRKEGQCEELHRFVS
jgi:hypothetical protein